MRERVQKLLARAGIASRRQAEGLIVAGRVMVNGEVAQLGDSADPARDVVLIDGCRIDAPSELTYLALHKPVGYVTTARSTHGEPTVMQLVDPPQRVFPVGRLDRDTSGLLLLTNDGAWANRIAHPRYGIEKEYAVTVRGSPSGDTVRRLEHGIVLPDGSMTAPARVQVERELDGCTHLAVTVVEGKKRQIRLMFGAVGHEVQRLERFRIDGIRLGALERGRWRHLERREVEGVRDGESSRADASRM